MRCTFRQRTEGIPSAPCHPARADLLVRDWGLPIRHREEVAGAAIFAKYRIPARAVAPAGRRAAVYLKVSENYKELPAIS